MQLKIEDVEGYTEVSCFYSFRQCPTLALKLEVLFLDVRLDENSKKENIQSFNSSSHW